MAICYDFGFYTKAGMAFFTCFSLAEHLLFALEIAPIILLYLLASMGPALFGEGRSWEAIVAELSSLIVGITGLLIALWPNGYSAWIQLGISLGFSLALFAVLHWLRPARGFVHFFTVFVGIFLSMALGRYIATSSTTGEPDYRIQLKGKLTDRKVNLVRSGERGALVWDFGTKSFHLISWDGIAEVEPISR